MSLVLYYHPLSSFCWKALIALYEADVAFEPRLVNLGDPADRARFQAVWPLAKFPVLRDETQDQTVPESTLIVEYLTQTCPQALSLIPSDPGLGRQVRLLDRVIDSYVHLPLQQVVAERMRPEDKHDPFGAEQARANIRQGYDALTPMISAPWAAGESFTLADCAALPALYYADYAVPLTGWPKLDAYLGRLKARPSVARVLSEAEPFFQYFPLRDG